MLKIILEITAGVFFSRIFVFFLFLFVFIDLIHDYCKKHVDKIEGRQVEIE